MKILKNINILQKRLNEIQKKLKEPKQISKNLAESEIKYSNNSSNKANRNRNNTFESIKQTLTKEEIRKKYLEEIFYFYSKQHRIIPNNPTFDQLRYNDDHMQMSEFKKFCIDFKILVHMNKLTEIFKQEANVTRYMDFNQFLKAIKIIAQEVNKNKQNYLKEKIKLNRLKLKESLENEKNSKEKNIEKVSEEEEKINEEAKNTSDIENKNEE